jgi:hypothetical protein
VGVDARGNATAVWARATLGAAFPQRLRVARSAGGGAWVDGPDLPAGETPFTSPSGLVDVAVAASGATLLTWVTGAGVHAALGSEPPALVAAVPGAGTPTAAIADDGTALVAFGDPGGRGRRRRASCGRQLATAARALREPACERDRRRRPAALDRRRRRARRRWSRVGRLAGGARHRSAGHAGRGHRARRRAVGGRDGGAVAHT